MPSRAVGVFFAVAGAVLLAVTMWGATLAPAVPGTDLESRWLLTCGVLAIIAIATGAGGIVLALRRWWGLLLISAAMALWAIYPWLLKMHYCVIYGFEEPSAVETALLALASLIVLITYIQKADRSVDA